MVCGYPPPLAPGPLAPQGPLHPLESAATTPPPPGVGLLPAPQPLVSKRTVWRCRESLSRASTDPEPGPGTQAGSGSGIAGSRWTRQNRIQIWRRFKPSDPCPFRLYRLVPLHVQTWPELAGGGAHATLEPMLAWPTCWMLEAPGHHAGCWSWASMAWPPCARSRPSCDEIFLY